MCATAPRRSAARSMPSPPARSTSRWRSASRSSRTPATAACRRGRGGTLNDLWSAERHRRRAASRSSPPPIAPSTASPARTSSGPSATSRGRATRTAPRTPRRTCGRPSTMDTILNAPMIAEPLGLFDCCGVSRRRGLRDRHDAGDRQGARQEGHRLPSRRCSSRSSNGVASRATTPGTAATSHTTRIAAQAGLRGGRHQGSARGVSA